MTARPEAGLGHAVWRLRAGYDGPHLVAVPGEVLRGGMTPGREEHAALAAAVLDDFVGECRGAESHAIGLLDARSEHDLRG